MVLAYNLIVPYLSIVDPKESQASAYTFLTLCPLCFLIGLTIFVLPSFWQGESKLTVLLNTVLGWNFWNHIDKISMNLFLLGPAVIGFTTYSLQNSIYFDFETVITYFFGDIVIIYVLSLLATAAI